MNKQSDKSRSLPIQNGIVLEDNTDIRTYKLISKYDGGRGQQLRFQNINNDLDTFIIDVTGGQYISSEEGKKYFIEVTSKRIWYTLWMKKVNVYTIVGNAEGDSILVISNEPKDKETLEKLKKEWYNNIRRDNK